MASKPFDITIKDLIETDAIAWAGLLLGEPIRRVTVLDADLATVSAAPDKVFRIETPSGPYLWNVEAQSGHSAKIPAKLHFDGTLLSRRHSLPVRSSVVLLRRKAHAKRLSGTYEAALPGSPIPYLTFRYEISRIWELSEEKLLRGRLATLPLAGLTDEASEHLPRVIARVEDRVRSEADPDLADRLLVATLVLLGLRYPRELAERLFKGIFSMEDSVTYQAILEKGVQKGIREGKREGLVDGERRVLLRMGTKKFGPPTASTKARLEAITDLKTLEALGERLLDVLDWKTLLGDQP